MPDFLQKKLQFQVLTLMCTSEEAIPLIGMSMEASIFDSPEYREIGRVATNFYNQYRKPVGDYLWDALTEAVPSIENNDDGTRDTYMRLVTDIFGADAAKFNVEYLKDKLGQFVRDQKLKHRVVTMAEQIRDGETDAAYALYNKPLIKQAYQYQDLAKFWELTSWLKIYDEKRVALPTGVAVLDHLEVAPALGELFIVLAPPNRGKTWCLVNLGKVMLTHGYKVLHISLEMARQRITQRYIQALFSYGKYADNQHNLLKFERDEMGKVNNAIRLELQRPGLFSRHDENDNEGRARLTRDWERTKNRFRLIVEEFPEKTLTLDGLEHFLDYLVRVEGFDPDAIFIDYPEKMKWKGDNRRESIEELTQNLRRIARERNKAIVAPSQSNRAGESALVLTGQHFAEDYSKYAIADNAIAYCQTSIEQYLGLARLFVLKAREEARGQTIVITQGYSFGQFCLDSFLLEPEYWQTLQNMNVGGYVTQEHDVFPKVTGAQQEDEDDGRLPKVPRKRSVRKRA